MPRLNKTCATCAKKIPSKDYEARMVVTSLHTGDRWCGKCTLRFIKRRIK